MAFDAALLSRFQFAFLAMFHILWPVLTIGLSLFLVAFEALWLWRRDPVYLGHARFWTRLFLLNFGIGVATGIPMEFQFGTNWARFASYSGGFFGDCLGFEGAMAFMLEAAFLSVMVFGRQRVSPRVHLFATAMVAAGGSLSAFWIMAANSWMHTPAAGTFLGDQFVVSSYAEAIFNPDAPWGISHMWVAALEISVFVVGGVSAWYIRRGRHVGFFLRSFRMALVAAVAVAPLQIYLGDSSGLAVSAFQPSKLAAMEAHWETNPPGEPAAWNVLARPDRSAQRNLWQLQVPYLLSLLDTRSLRGSVKGLKEYPPAEQPPVALPFYAFRVMVLAGFVLAGVVVWTLVAWWRGELESGRVERQRTLLLGWVVSAPLAYLAMEAGWVVREVGRQPWIIYGVFRTQNAVSPVPGGAVLASLTAYVVLYAAVLAFGIVFARKLLREGPGEEAT